MGAFIAYLHSAYGINNYFILAPNLTIYNKLITDFTPNTPKYVFTGLTEFSSYSPPEIITGDNYEQRGSLIQSHHGSLLSPVVINVFNISKINSEVRGGKSPRIKRLFEYLGESYFDYLSGLPDLVLLMDESHRYRASAGIHALNELKPLLGLELTATPFTEGHSAKSGVVSFKNVMMDYPLGRAIEEGFVKEPAVVTQKNFDPSAHTAEALELIKLQDGIRIHEETKIHLLTYSKEVNEKLVKPFILVIARDTTHASELIQKIESESFFEGRYKGKVIQVDSSRSGAEEDEMIRRLLAVERYEEPTEIVIHVNMLKEGWDVTNLYTIVPLRAANARTLIEQSIGRGLRLPYGRKTGVEVVDRLNIIAHDRFQEVIDEAGRSDSPIRLRKLELSSDMSQDDHLASVTIESNVSAMLGITSSSGHSSSYKAYISPPVFSTPQEQKIAKATIEVIAELTRQKHNGEPYIPSSQALNNATVQKKINERVQEHLALNGSLFEEESNTTVQHIIEKTVEILLNHTIDIPRIIVMPKNEVAKGYKPFEIDITPFNFQPQDMELMGQGLHSGTQVTYGQSSVTQENVLENYIIRELIDYDDICYDHDAELIHSVAQQVVNHFQSKEYSATDLHNILSNHANLIAKYIHLQMQQHYLEDHAEYEVIVTQGMTELKKSNVVIKGEVLPLYQPPAEKSQIAKYLYGGFKKCGYPVQKFHSDTERILASILESNEEVRFWLRPVAGQFNITYRICTEKQEYIPDFVAATHSINLLIETKSTKDLSSPEVEAKTSAVLTWCKHASDYAKKNDGKEWAYLLIPHDVVASNITINVLLERYRKSL